MGRAGGVVFLALEQSGRLDVTVGRAAKHLGVRLLKVFLLVILIQRTEVGRGRFSNAIPPDRSEMNDRTS
jgi:hypothetical protein